MHAGVCLDKVPQIVLDAVGTRHEEELMRPFEYSATVLCKSPRQCQLERRHQMPTEEDSPIDFWYSFLGTAVHNHIENQLKGNLRYICEKRIVRHDKPLGAPEQDYRSVGAKFDAYDKEDKKLIDHKTTTTYIHGKEMKEEWIRQLMINAYFLMKEGYQVDWLSINAIYMDWRDAKLKYAKAGEYPTSPCAEFTVACPPENECEALYKNLLEQHIAAENISDDDLPLCSSEYCWERGGCYAVYKPGADRATRLLSTYDEALAYISQKKLYGYCIETRPASRMRCERYCNAKNFCNQYQAFVLENKRQEEENQKVVDTFAP